MGDGVTRKLIIPKGVLEEGNNVIDIPESCEESRVLIAKLQAKLANRPPKTTDIKFERRINDQVVGMGLQPLSPVKEERHNYNYSLSQYGQSAPSPYVSYQPSYFSEDSSMNSTGFSGKFGVCPSSTPVPQTPFEYGSPRTSPVRLGRDIFAPEASAYRSAFTPSPRSLSPVRPAPSSPSPKKPPPKRNLFPAVARPPVPKQPNSQDISCSFGDLSDLMESSRGQSMSARGTSGISGIAPLDDDSIPEELDNSAINESLELLEYVELDELRKVQDKMRKFQDARRELMISVLCLHEVDPNQDCSCGSN